MPILQNAINGKKITSDSLNRVPVFNPATGEQSAELPLSSVKR